LSGILPRFPEYFPFLYAFSNRSGLLKYPRLQSLFKKAYFLYKEHVEDPYLMLARNHADLFAGGHILDVGANIGYTAVLFANSLSSPFKVFAFEPEEKNFYWLKEGIAERSLEEKIIPVRAAVGDREGMYDLWLNPGTHADHRIMTPGFQTQPGHLGPTQKVPMMRLDDFCARELRDEPIRFIKIDVQGYEECVCRGMEETLRKNPDAHIGLEYYPEGIEQLGFKPLDILHFFQERGYRAFSFTRRRPLTFMDYTEISKIVEPKGYIDFLFTKSTKILDQSI
jgi:FkbM family methyltransferase